MLKPKGKRPSYGVLPPALVPSYGSRHTTLATTGAIWVTNTGNNTVEKIDTTTLAVEVFPSGGRTPSGLASDGTYLYVVNYGNSKLAKLELDGTLVLTKSLGIGIHQVIYANGYLFVTDYFSGQVYRVNPANLVADLAYPCGHYPVHLTFDGTNVWIACWDYTTNPIGVGKVVKLSQSLALLGEYTTCDNPYGIVFDGTYIWVASFVDGNLYQLNLDGTVENSYSSGVTDVFNTGLTFVPFTPNLIAKTLTKDFSPHDLAGNYNKCQLVSVEDGTVYQLEDLGIDPRNTSVDEFNYAYTAGYGDGSITRFLIGTAVPPEPPTGMQSITLATPYIMYVEPIGGLLYVASTSASGAVYSVPLGTITATMFKGSLDNPTTITFDGTYLYVTLMGWAFGQIGIAKYALDGTFISGWNSGMGRTTRHTSEAPDGTDLFVLSYSDVALYRVSSSTGAVLDSLALPAYGTYVLYSHGYIWVTCSNGTLLKIDPSLNIVATLVIAGSEEVIFVGSDLWAVGGSNLYRISPTTFTVLNTYTLTGVSSSLTLLESGFIAVPIASTMEILYIDPVTGSVHSSISTSPTPLDRVIGSGNMVYGTSYSTNTLLFIS